jgi:hypothetical protein
MRGMKQRVQCRVWDRGLLLMAALCMLFAPAFAQDTAQQGKNGKAPAKQNGGFSRGHDTVSTYQEGNGPAKKIAGGFETVQVLSPGGSAPRTPDGHPDLSGRWWPNHAGRMLEGAYPVPAAVRSYYDRKDLKPPMFRPEVAAKYEHPTPYGSCPPGGTPTSITTQATEHGPMQLVQDWKDKALWVLSEFPQTIRRIPTNGRPHPKDPPPTFNGDSVGRWEGNTLVVDTIAIDTRVRNISVGIPGDAHAWLHSPQEHVIERFSRPSKNYLTYQVTVIDPVVLEKPFVSPPYTWSLAQSPDDVWTEYICTDDQEPGEWQKYRQQVGDK